MSMPWDRVKASFLALVGAAQPRAVYHGFYRGTVMGQTGDVVDVKMDDAMVPGMGSLAIQVGLPGCRVEFAAGARMLVAFENGDPAKPIAALWDAGTGATVTLMTLGSRSATEALLHGTSYMGAFGAMVDALDIAFDAMQAACTPLPLVPLKAPIASIQLAIKTYKATAGVSGNFLSQVMRTI